MSTNTDLLKKLSRKWVGQIGAAGVADAVVTTIPLSSTTNLATDTGIVVTIDRVDVNGAKTLTLEESVIGVVSGSNLVTCTRGVEGTAQAHSAGAVVEILITAKGYNDIIDHLLVEHSQLGVHTSALVTSLEATGANINTGTSGVTIVTPKAIADSKVSLSDKTETLTNKTLTSPKINEAVTLTATATQLNAQILATNDGWTLANETWTYASASTITVPAGAASKYAKGDRIKWTQTTVKYGVIVTVADTLLTIAVNTDYVVTDAAITLNFYSHQASPIGYPDWFSYTPTFVGFSTAPTVFAKFKISSREVTVYHYTSTTGTSNATTFTTIAPVVSANVGRIIYSFANVTDNGTEAGGALRIGQNTTTIEMLKNFVSDTFTNTGGKHSCFIFSYDI